MWIALAVLFGAGVYCVHGTRCRPGVFRRLLIEKALSVDNIFVFVLIFGFFRVPFALSASRVVLGHPRRPRHARRHDRRGRIPDRSSSTGSSTCSVPFWSSPGSGWRRRSEHDIDPESNPAIRLVRRLMPVTDAYHGQKFFVREHVAGKLRLVATPLFVVAGARRDNGSHLCRRFHTGDLRGHAGSVHRLQLECLRDPRLACAVLPPGGGDSPVPLPEGRVCLSCSSSSGVKMLAGDVYKVPVGVSLGVIVCVLGASIGASWLWPSTAAAHHVPDPASGAGSAPPDSGGTELRRQFPRVPGEENADSVEPVRGTS